MSTLEAAATPPCYALQCTHASVHAGHGARSARRQVGTASRRPSVSPQRAASRRRARASPSVREGEKSRRKKRVWSEGLPR